MATRTGGGWRLDGVKQFVLDGHAADAMLIAAKTGDERRCFCPADAAGLSRDTRTLVDGRRVATIALDGILVGSGARLEGGAATIEESSTSAGRSSPPRSAAWPKRRSRARRATSRTGASSVADRQLPGAAASRARVHLEVENAWSATLQTLQSIEARANSAAFDVAITKAEASETASRLRESACR